MQSLLLRGEGGLLRVELVDHPAEDSPPPPEPVPPDAGPLRRNAKLGIDHTPNFRVVRWGRETFSFSHKQSLVVESLANAAAAGFEWVDQFTLLECADSDGTRLYDLFRGHPAWGRMIVRHSGDAAGPGAFALAKPV